MARVIKKEKKRGFESTLTDEIIDEIKRNVMSGYNYMEIANNIGVPYKTLCHWRYQNVHQLADQIQQWEMERTLELAEAVGREILTMDDVKEDGTINPSLRAIKQREAEYTRDALIIARKKWSKKDTININVQLPQPILGNMFDTLDKAIVVEDEKSLIE